MSKEVKFEDQVKELEKLINELESGEVDLDKSIEKYTQAMKLVKECDKKLKHIERVQERTIQAEVRINEVKNVRCYKCSTKNNSNIQIY